MADIYFRKVKTVEGEYWQLYGLKNVKPDERMRLGLECQEYLTMCGDIGTSSRVVEKELRQIRDTLEKQGHALHYK